MPAAQAGATLWSSSATRPRKSAPIAAQFGAQTILQKPQRGTGHAMQVARRAIRKSAKLAIVAPGDAPLLRPETLAALLDTHRRGEACRHDSHRRTREPAGYGRIVRDSEGRVQAIVEEESATPDAARHPRSQFRHLLLHARKALAVLERAAPR